MALCNNLKNPSSRSAWPVCRAALGVVCLSLLLTGFAAQVPSPQAPAEPTSAPVAASPEVNANEPAPNPASVTPPQTAAREEASTSETRSPAHSPTASGPSASVSSQAPPAAPAPPVRPAPTLLPDMGRIQPAPTALTLNPLEISAPHALKAFMDMFVDSSTALTVQDVMKLEEGFTPWHGEARRESGIVWVRVRIAPMLDGMSEQLYVHLGSAVPGRPSMWMTRPGSTEPVVVRPDEGNRYPLLYSQTGGAIYIRLEGSPAIHFTPWVGAQQDAAPVQDLAFYVIIGLLGLAAFICLVRGLAERREWRIWAGLFAFAALVYALCGLPALGAGKLTPGTIPALLAPALCLFILPHAGRHLMQPRNTMPWLDNAFILVSLLGLCAGLLPLLPQQAWLVYFQPLWPLGLAVTLVLCLPACRKGLAGWGRFCFAALWCILLIIPLIAPFAPTHPEFSEWNALAPLLGLTLTALLFALVGGRPAPRSTVERRKSRHKPQMPHMSMDMHLCGEADDDLPLPGMTGRGKTADASQKKGGMPTLSTFDSGTARTSTVPARKKEAAVTTKAAQPHNPAPARDEAFDPVLLTRLEESLRVPLDALLRQAITLDMFTLPDEARPHVAKLVAAGRNLNSIITTITRTGVPNPSRMVIEEAYIDLPRLLRDAHASVTDEAEDRNLAVSWYMAPHLGRNYTGPASRLKHIMNLLVASAVQATTRGSVQLWARRVQESNDPGHLVFTVADTGSGMPPERRNPLLPAMLWELVGEVGGSLHIDSNMSGTTISFSISLKALPTHGSLPMDEGLIFSGTDGFDTPLALPSLSVILADDAPSRRQLLAYMLEDLPHELVEARSAAEAVSIHTEIPARLIIFDGNMPEKELIDAVAAIRNHDGEHELPPTRLLALVGHEAQGERLRRAGVDHILYKPVNRAIVRQAVLHLAPVPGMELPPLPETPVMPVPQIAETAESMLPDTPVLTRDLTMPAEKPHTATAPSETPLREKQDASVHKAFAGSPSGGTSKQSSEEPTQRKAGVLNGLFGTRPRKNFSSGPVAEPFLSTGNVGEPMPVPRRAEASVEEAPSPTTPNITIPFERASPGQLFESTRLSENGVGEPMPIVKRAAPEEIVPENGVDEPVSIASVPDEHIADGSFASATEPSGSIDDTKNAEASLPDEAPAPDATPVADAAKTVDVPPASRAGMLSEVTHAPEAIPSVNAIPASEASSPWRGVSLFDLIEEVGPAEAENEEPHEAPKETSDETLDKTPEASVAKTPADNTQNGTDEHDAIFATLLQSLDELLTQAQEALENNDMPAVMTAAGKIAEQAEQFGLHVPAKFARAIEEMAGGPDGFETVEETMSDLRTAIERNKSAFNLS